MHDHDLSHVTRYELSFSSCQSPERRRFVAQTVAKLRPTPLRVRAPQRRGACRSSGLRGEDGVSNGHTPRHTTHAPLKKRFRSTLPGCRAPTSTLTVGRRRLRVQHSDRTQDLHLVLDQQPPMAGIVGHIICPVARVRVRQAHTAPRRRGDDPSDHATVGDDGFTLQRTASSISSRHRVGDRPGNRPGALWSTTAVTAGLGQERQQPPPAMPPADRRQRCWTRCPQLGGYDGFDMNDRSRRAVSATTS